MTPPAVPAVDRIVCDCNVLFQALVSAKGPSRAVFDAAVQGRFALFISNYVIRELKSVVSRPDLIRRFDISKESLQDFLAVIELRSTLIEDVPHVFDLPRDPKDAHFVDLAVAAKAQLIVSRDNDLLSLADRANVHGKDFAARFPVITILTPPQLLERLRASAP